MAHRIRKAMEREPMAGMLTGTVEADETYIGGRPRRKNNAPRMTPKEAARHRMDNKVPVVSLVQRGGEVRSRVMKKVTGANLGKLLQRERQPALHADDGRPAASTSKPGKKFARHEAVDHSLGEYVRGDAHINTAEGYFSQLKRSIDGTHHHVSEQHLHRYLGEFDFRYNTRRWRMASGRCWRSAWQRASGSATAIQSRRSSKAPPENNSGGVVHSFDGPPSGDRTRTTGSPFDTGPVTRFQVGRVYLFRHRGTGG